MFNLFYWFNKKRSHCLICEKPFYIVHKTGCPNGIKMPEWGLFVPRDKRSKELCHRCFEDFVVKKIHLRLCKNTEFLFRSYQREPTAKDLTPCSYCKNN